MPTITKQELWRRVLEQLAPVCSDSRDGRINLTSGEAAALATARALGYEVVDEPALPERLERFDLGPASTVLREPCGPHRPLIGLERRRDVPWGLHCDLIAELVRRYNAKAAVLAVAEELAYFARANGGSCLTAVDRLRAAYEDPA